jgi:hypothetical protein
MSGATDYDKLKTFLVLLFVFVFLLNAGKKSGWFEPKLIDGNGYKMDFPVGWIRNTEETKDIRMEGSLYETQIITYDSPQKDPKTGEPEARLQMYARKLESAMWIEDEWVDIVSSIRKARFIILDKGEIKLDGEISKWLVFHDQKRTALILEFYFVTDSNVFYKIRYVGTPKGFSKHRPDFEEAKSTFKLKMNLL